MKKLDAEILLGLCILHEVAAEHSAARSAAYIGNMVMGRVNAEWEGLDGYMTQMSHRGARHGRTVLAVFTDSRDEHGQQLRQEAVERNFVLDFEQENIEVFTALQPTGSHTQGLIRTIRNECRERRERQTGFAQPTDIDIAILHAELELGAGLRLPAK